jgi:hypothetical protein
MGYGAKHDTVDLDAILDAMIYGVKTPAILARSPGRRGTRSMINGAILEPQATSPAGA